MTGMTVLDRDQASVGTSGLRLAFVAGSDPSDPSTQSGSSFCMITSLRRKGVTVIPVASESPRERMLRRIPRPLRRVLRSVGDLTGLRRPYAQAVCGECVRDAMLRRVEKRARRVKRLLAGIDCDVIFGCFASAVISRLETDRPIAYYSDATPELINSTYPRYMVRSAVYKATYDAFEARAIARARLAVYSSRLVADSAIEKYGLARENAGVVMMGANVGISDLDGEDHDPTPPTKDDLRLCIVAIDSVRKGLAKAAEATAILRARGWNATLTHAGAPCNGVSDAGVVKCAGLLSLAIPSEKRKLARIMASSHIMLMPSVGEAFGISMAEAAAFGRPGVVSDVGGLPEVVLDGKTGAVVPVESSAQAYADAVERIAEDETRYRAMSEACLDRSRTVLNWDTWAEEMLALIDKSLARGR